jgi:hypothetical protein
MNERKNRRCELAAIRRRSISESPNTKRCCPDPVPPQSLIHPLLPMNELKLWSNNNCRNIPNKCCQTVNRFQCLIDKVICPNPSEQETPADRGMQTYLTKQCSKCSSPIILMCEALSISTQNDLPEYSTEGGPE